MNVVEMLAEREGRYGQFAIHASIAQGLKFEMSQSPNWANMEPAMKESLEMIQHKVARILNGDPYYIDNWVDIAGYTQLVIDILKRFEGEEVAAA